LLPQFNECVLRDVPCFVPIQTRFLDHTHDVENLILVTRHKSILVTISDGGRQSLCFVAVAWISHQFVVVALVSHQFVVNEKNGQIAFYK
jgi:hypothetical protein